MKRFVDAGHGPGIRAEASSVIRNAEVPVIISITSAHAHNTEYPPIDAPPSLLFHFIISFHFRLCCCSTVSGNLNWCANINFLQKLMVPPLVLSFLFGNVITFREFWKRLRKRFTRAQAFLLIFEIRALGTYTSWLWFLLFPTYNSCQIGLADRNNSQNCVH